jgi:hypothetical protein
MPTRPGAIIGIALSIIFLTVWLAVRFRYPWNPFGSTKATFLWMIIAAVIGLSLGLVVRAVRKH